MLLSEVNAASAILMLLIVVLVLLLVSAGHKLVLLGVSAAQ